MEAESSISPRGIKRKILDADMEIISWIQGRQSVFHDCICLFGCEVLFANMIDSYYTVLIVKLVQ